jgi:hypothetical protein
MKEIRILVATDGSSSSLETFKVSSRNIIANERICKWRLSYWSDSYI